jgi:hypothetical protein
LVNLMMRGAYIVFCVVVIALCGCQQPAPPAATAHPAAGSVVYRGGGGPVTGRIKFRPVGDSSYFADGTVGKDGKFSLSTRRVGSEEATPGIPAGHYRVSVTPISGATRPPPIELPDVVTVHEGENTFSFEIAK